jgi:hypothetical protein
VASLGQAGSYDALICNHSFDHCVPIVVTPDILEVCPVQAKAIYQLMDALKSEHEAFGCAN